MTKCFERLIKKYQVKKTRSFTSYQTQKTTICYISSRPFVKSFNGNVHLLILVDNFTQLVRLYPTKSKKVINVPKFLEGFYHECRLPERIMKDSVAYFTSHAFEEYCRVNGMIQTLTSTQQPQGNGMVERVNKIVLPIIMTSMTDPRHKDWEERIKKNVAVV